MIRFFASLFMRNNLSLLDSSSNEQILYEEGSPVSEIAKVSEKVFVSLTSNPYQGGGYYLASPVPVRVLSSESFAVTIVAAERKGEDTYLHLETPHDTWSVSLLNFTSVTQLSVEGINYIPANYSRSRMVRRIAGVALVITASIVAILKFSGNAAPARVETDPIQNFEAKTDDTVAMKP